MSISQTWKLNPSQKGPWHLLIGPYNATLVGMLKSQIPVEGRSWDPTLKAWKIGDDHVVTAKEIIMLVEQGLDEQGLEDDRDYW